MSRDLRYAWRVPFAVFEAQYCAFCGKLDTAVGASPDLVICRACLVLTSDILIDDRNDISPDLFGDAWLGDITQRLLQFYDPATGRLLRPAPEFEGASELYRCSFCATPRREAARLVAGPDIFLCDRCVARGLIAHLRAMTRELRGAA